MGVVELNLNDWSVRASVLALQRGVFHDFPEDMLRHTIDHPARDSIAYGIYEGSALAAVTQFIAHSAHRNGVTGTAFQACGVATRQESAGKGYFSRIVDFAKRDLREKGAAFVFGFPNPAAKRVWVDKKGFSLSPSTSSLVFRTPVGAIGSFDGDRLSGAMAAESLVTFDYRETACWKKRRTDRNIFEHEALTNYLFGKIIRKRRFGLSLNLLVIGGVEINKPHQIDRFLSGALKAANCRALRIVSNAAGPLAGSAMIRRGTGLTEPVIAFGLGWQVEASDLDALGGLKDVY